MSTKLAEIEAKRAAYQAQCKRDADEQKATDLEAVFALECERGDSNVTVLEVPYTEGLPVLVAARCPSGPEMKRYRDRCKSKNADRLLGDTVAAAEELAAVCRIYPDVETYEKIKAARPGVHAQLGTAAVTLASGKADSEGKG